MKQEQNERAKRIEWVSFSGGFLPSLAISRDTTSGLHARLPQSSLDSLAHLFALLKNLNFDQTKKLGRRGKVEIGYERNGREEGEEEPSVRLRGGVLSAAPSEEGAKRIEWNNINVSSTSGSHACSSSSKLARFARSPLAIVVDDDERSSRAGWCNSEGAVVGEGRRVHDVHSREDGGGEGLEDGERGVNWGDACLVEEQIGLLEGHFVKCEAARGTHQPVVNQHGDLGRVVEVVAAKHNTLLPPLDPKPNAGNRVQTVKEAERAPQDLEGLPNNCAA